jgi:ABC-type multidrug transport system fused ATPase/permease subunit
MYADFGYMEEGKLGKPYDLKLMARLWVFLRPHWFLMVVSLLFVLIMATLDLFIPYLTKEAIDRYIVLSAREVVIKGDQSIEEKRLLSRVGQDLVPRKKKGDFPPSEVLRSPMLRRWPSFKIWTLSRTDSMSIP